MGRDIEDYQHSKTFKEYSVQNDRSRDGITESRFIEKKHLTTDKDLHKEYISLSYNNGSKYYNNSTDYWGEINQSMKKSIKHHKVNDVIHEKEDESG